MAGLFPTDFSTGNCNAVCNVSDSEQYKRGIQIMKHKFTHMPARLWCCLLALALVMSGAGGLGIHAKAEAAQPVQPIALTGLISVGGGHMAAVRADGTVVAAGDNSEGQCDVEDWEDIVAVSAGWLHTVGLRADGTVVATGDNSDGQCNVQGRTDIVSVAAGDMITLGLRSDGTVVATSSGMDYVTSWRGITAISAGYGPYVGLRADGTVVAEGDNSSGSCDVQDWTDIVQISAGNFLTVGLRADGTVVAAGDNTYGQCDVADWRDITAVAAGSTFTAGLRSDGTVITTLKMNRQIELEDQLAEVYGEGVFHLDMDDWEDIIGVCAGGYGYFCT